MNIRKGTNTMMNKNLFFALALGLSVVAVNAADANVAPVVDANVAPAADVVAPVAPAADVAPAAAQTTWEWTKAKCVNGYTTSKEAIVNNPKTSVAVGVSAVVAAVIAYDLTRKDSKIKAFFAKKA